MTTARHGDGQVEPLDDEALVDRARRGDADARESLFGRHHDVAFRVAYRLLSNREDALDAVQESFVKAFRHLDAFDGRSAFRTWLLRIVSNASRDQGRRRGRRPAVRLADPEADDASPGAGDPSVEPDPAEGLHRDDLRRALDRAVGQLSPTLRDTFVLFAEAELSYKEIAESQGIPIGTVMSRINSARAKLRRSLDGLLDDP